MDNIQANVIFNIHYIRYAMLSSCSIIIGFDAGCEKSFNFANEESAKSNFEALKRSMNTIEHNSNQKINIQ